MRTLIKLLFYGVDAGPPEEQKTLDKDFTEQRKAEAHGFGLCLPSFLLIMDIMIPIKQRDV